MIDTFSCIPFELPHLIFKVELAINNTFSFKEFLLIFKEPTLPATAVQFFTVTSNLHKVTSFLTSPAIKANVT